MKPSHELKELLSALVLRRSQLVQLIGTLNILFIYIAIISLEFELEICAVGTSEPLLKARDVRILPRFSNKLGEL